MKSLNQLNIDNENFLYLIFNNADGQIKANEKLLQMKTKKH